MRLAVDTSALLAILNGESTGEAWLDALVGTRSKGQLVVCEVVYAELSTGFSDRSQLDGALSKLGVRFDSIGEKAAWTAGSLFRRYRREGGTRTRLIPDFLIAAHANEQADGLAAEDRGYLRRYFPKLELLRMS